MEEITYFGTRHGGGNRSEVYNKLEEIKPEILTLEMPWIEHIDEFITSYNPRSGQEIQLDRIELRDNAVDSELLVELDENNEPTLEIVPIEPDDNNQTKTNSEEETVELFELSYQKQFSQIATASTVILPKKIGTIVFPEEVAFLTYAIDNKIPIYCIENVRIVPSEEDMNLIDVSMKDYNVIAKIQPTDLENILNLKLIELKLPTNFSEDYNKEDPHFVEQSNRVMANNLNTLIYSNNTSVAHLSGSAHLGFENSAGSDKELIKNLTKESLLLQDLVNSENFTLWDCVENKEYRA